MMSAVVAMLLMAAEPVGLVRDPTVEQPFTAGLLYGVTLGACVACRHGAGVVPAGPYDPFGMTASTHRTLKSIGAQPYALGLFIGRVLALLTIVGLILKILTTLERRGGLGSAGRMLRSKG